MKEKLQRFVDWCVLHFWDVLRPRVHTRPIPSQPGVDFTGDGWGRRFQQAIEDAEGMNPVSIELIRGQHATGDQRWIAMIWDGDESIAPTVMGTGKDPAVALRDANRDYRKALVEEGTVQVWRKPR